MFHLFRANFHAFEVEIFQHRFVLALLVVTLVAIGIAVWAIASRKRYIVLQHSAESDALIVLLGRIAAALERRNARDEVPDFSSQEILRETPTEPVSSVETVQSPPPLSQVGVGSMFGFNRNT